MRSAVPVSGCRANISRWRGLPPTAAGSRASSCRAAATPWDFPPCCLRFEKALQLTGKPGEFERARRLRATSWPAVIRFTPYRKAAGGTVEEGTLEFFAGIDGVKKEEAVWDALLEEKKAREAQARQVDSLFE